MPRTYVCIPIIVHACIHRLSEALKKIKEDELKWKDAENSMREELETLRAELAKNNRYDCTCDASTYAILSNLCMYAVL
jgi:hypothetical protein